MLHAGAFNVMDHFDWPTEVLDRKMLHFRILYNFLLQCKFIFKVLTIFLHCRLKQAAMKSFHPRNGQSINNLQGIYV